ncbi:HAMP domain-containing protein [Trinickia terrae]|uniref:histidine kinase n=1 Tax=Trinickia terrae TaxID=2571161 RepID=A0A4U1I4T2_9BURK|nr:ATP-binding protein [Trinickia terrae]TKC88294.1 HAMP domain-containing protein [Trinickia terrae]
MLNHWIRSLSTRLWATNMAAFAVSLVVLATIVIYVFSQFPEQSLGRREQTEMVGRIAAGLDFDDAGRPVSVRLPGELAWVFQVLPADLQYRVYDGQGRLLLASTGARDSAPWLPDSLGAAAGSIVHVTIDGKRFAIATRQVSRGQAAFYVQTATSAQFTGALVRLKIQPIPRTVETVVFIATIIFGLTLPLTIRRVLRPLREVSQAAAQITPRNLKTRLSTKGIPTELTPLINAFNEALARLENGFKVQQQFLAAAAHELQTPLTLIRGQIELQPEIEEKEQLFREIDLMARQVRQLLHLAEVSEAQNFTFGEVRIVDVAQDVVGYLARKADAKQVKLQLKESRALSPIWADRSALFILLKNIVENAINVSPANGVVTLMIDEVSIQVEDDGPGIPQEYVPFLFKRFWRAPESRHDGAGLGLAICKEIALAHEWRLTVSSLSTGTRFVVWL